MERRYVAGMTQPPGKRAAVDYSVSCGQLGGEPQEATFAVALPLLLDDEFVEFDEFDDELDVDEVSFFAVVAAAAGLSACLSAGLSVVAVVAADLASERLSVR
jgi:hypothetical protein